MTSSTPTVTSNLSKSTSIGDEVISIIQDSIKDVDTIGKSIDKMQGIISRYKKETSSKPLTKPPLFLLNPSNKNYRLDPYKYSRVMNWLKLHYTTIWFADEIEMSQDIIDWNTKLDKDMRFFISKTLAFFATSDFLVNEAISKDNDEVVINEYNMFNRWKAAMEDIHSQTYFKFIDQLITNEKEKEVLFDAIKTDPVIKRKADWYRRWISTGTFVERLIATAIMEGIFFCGSFCSIFWLRSKGLMPGLIQGNAFISRDEGLHRDKACDDYVTDIPDEEKLSESRLLEIVKDAVEIECDFVKSGLPVELIGINSGVMIQYIKHTADLLLDQLHVKKHYNVSQPFTWMSMINMEAKTEFFNRKPTAYSQTKIKINKGNDSKDNVVRFDDL